MADKYKVKLLQPNMHGETFLAVKMEGASYIHYYTEADVEALSALFNQDLDWKPLR